MLDRRRFLASSVVTVPIMWTGAVAAQSTRRQPDQPDPLLQQLGHEIGSTLADAQTSGVRAAHLQRLAGHLRVLAATAFDQTPEMQRFARDVKREGRVRDRALTGPAAEALRPLGQQFGLNLDDPLFAHCLVDTTPDERAHALASHDMHATLRRMERALSQTAARIARTEVGDGLIRRVQDQPPPDADPNWYVCIAFKTDIAALQATTWGFNAWGFFTGIAVLEFTLILGLLTILIGLLMLFACN